MLSGCLWLLWTGVVWAKVVPSQQSLLGDNIQTGQQLAVTDSRYEELVNSSASFTDRRATNRLQLSVNPNTVTTGSYTLTVRAKATYEVWNGSTFATQSKVIELVVDYAADRSYQDQAVAQWEGGHKLQVEVLSVSGTMTDATFTGSIEIERYDEFDATVAPGGLSFQEVPARGELAVQWEGLPGAEEYDLEWTYVNNYQADGGVLSANEVYIASNLFQHNSTRVSVKQNEYAIPLIYDQGYIICRVRAVGRSADTDFQLPVEGQWTYEPQGNHTVADAPHRFLFAGHQNNLNWQSTVSYAEEGKNKAAISYFDGSLRNRQVVSRLNSEDKIIVGETVYDYQGRPSVQILPVPARAAKIGYQRRFNLNPNGLAYSRTDFDRDLTQCEVAPLGLSTTSGASQYYSPSNPYLISHQAYLPDAQMYPFTQVEYTPDNTGRIRRQSGVGFTHRLGSGHETQYFYGKPFQEELDRMFGGNVGYAKHYKKNMVQDANGQISVSYLSPQGQVVATALAGETPQSLTSISEPEDEARTNVDLLGKASPTDRQGQEDRISLNGRSRLLTQQMLVSQRGSRSFDYGLQASPYKKDGFCYDCVYDLAIRLTDDCGNSVIPTVGNQYGAVGTTALNCQQVQGTSFTESFQTLHPLIPGSYNLARTLTINQAALDLYVEDFVARQGETDDLTFEDFLEKEREDIEIFDCEADCDACLEAVGDYSQYTLPGCDPCLTEAEYEARLADCDLLCQEENVQCENALAMMLTDVSPFGQYGAVMAGNQVNEDGTFTPAPSSEIDASTFPLSIYNEQNLLPQRTLPARPSWRNPYHHQRNETAYLNEAGEPDYVAVLILSDGTTNPLLQESFTLPESAQVGDIIQVLPQELYSEKELVRYWKPAWAASLVIYHPEYPYYEHCLQIDDSYSFDARWLNTTSVEKAIARNYLNELSEDPFFTAANGSQPGNPRFSADLTKAMNRALVAYPPLNIPLKEYVHRLANCPNVALDESTECTSCPEDDGINTDVEWNTYKSLYFSTKQRLVEKDMLDFGLDNQVMNTCLGGSVQDVFTYGRSLTIDFRSFMTRWRSIKGDYTCQNSVYDAFITKTKRFPLAVNMLGSDQDPSQCYQDIDTDQQLPGDEEVGFDVLECTDKQRGVIEEAEIQADMQFLERCGQCPLAHDLQVLLDGIAKKKGFGAEGFPLSCYPEGLAEWVPDLEQAMIGGWIGSGKIYWDRTSISERSLTATVHRRDDGNQCTVRLTTLEEGYRWQDVQGVCCLNYEPNPQAYGAVPNKNFAFMAQVDDSGKKIKVEGIIDCLEISGCQLPPVCRNTAEAGGLQTLLNTLVFDFEVGTRNTDLGKGETIDLTTGTYSELLLRALPSVPPTNRRWKGTVAGNQLTGVLSGVNEQGATVQSMVQLTKQSGFDFEDIVGFSNLRADVSHPQDPEHHFTVVAQVKTSLGNVEVAMPGYVSLFKISQCSYPELPSQ